MAWAPTTDQILNLDGVRRRADTFRFELCDKELTPIGELHPDRDSTPRITNDTSTSVSRRLSGLKLTQDEASDVNELTDRLRVYMVLQNGAEFRLGTFLWADVSEPLRSWGSEHNSELVDYGYILEQEVTRPYGWERGANMTLIIFFLLFRAGFELAQIAHIGHAADRGLVEAKSWEPGTTWSRMLGDIGDLVGFADPWFNRDGLLYFDAPPDPATSAPSVPPYDVNTRIVADTTVPSSNWLSGANDYAVFDSGTDRLRVGRYQVPSSAPHSFNKRGFRVGLVDVLQGLESTSQADRAARNLARTRGKVFEEQTFSSTADPRHDIWTIVPLFGDNWLETYWDLELRSGGLMKHTVRKTIYAP